MHYSYPIGFSILQCVKCCPCRRNQMSHVKGNIVHKLYRIQSIAPQPLSYFEGLVSTAALEAAKTKQAGRTRTWYTLTLESLNAVLNQVSHSSVADFFLLVHQNHSTSIAMYYNANNCLYLSKSLVKLRQRQRGVSTRNTPMSASGPES